MSQNLVNINADKPRATLNEHGQLVVRRVEEDIVDPPEGVESMEIIRQGLELAQNDVQWEMLQKTVEHFRKQLGKGNKPKKARRPRVSAEDKLNLLQEHMPRKKEEALRFAAIADLVGFTVNKAVLDGIIGENKVKYQEDPTPNQRGKTALICWWPRR